MFPFPAELLLEIFFHLTRKDLHHISRCSKSYRRQLLPFLFDRLSLSLDSLASFCEGGNFNYLCRYVRRINLIGQNNVSSSTSINQARICSSSLYLFPNATVFHIQPSISADLSFNLFASVLTQASHQQLYSNIKSLSLSYPDSQTPNFTSNTFLNITEINRQFIGKIPRNGSQLPEKFDLQPPSNLEEVVITVGEFSFFKPSRRYHPPFPNLYILDQSLASQLKRLEIRAQSLEFPQNNIHPVTYPNVTDLCMVFSRRPQGDLVGNIAFRFPRVEHLTIKTLILPVYGTRDHLAYTSFFQLTHLKTANIPWPRASWPNGCFKKKQVINCVRHLVSGGLAHLERMEFLKNPTARSQNTLSVRVIGEKKGWKLGADFGMNGELKRTIVHADDGELLPWPKEGSLMEHDVITLTAEPWAPLNPSWPVLWGNSIADDHEVHLR